MNLTKSMKVILLIGVVAAEPLTTIEACSAEKTVSACTVTAQHQTVSTCILKSSLCNGEGAARSCSTAYSYSTWAYVSTVIPCSWDGESASSCTVTKTDQAVPCFATATTITNIDSVETKDWRNWNNTNETSYEIVSKNYSAPYNKLGSFAIPGYGGNELCKECKVGEDEVQHYEVMECKTVVGKPPSCQKYNESQISKKRTPVVMTATNSVKTHIDDAGTYTFTFVNTAPATTITEGSEAKVMPAKQWLAYKTKSCYGPKDFDFTVTKTKTISVISSFSTYTVVSKTAVEAQKASSWGVWHNPVSVEAKTTKTGSGSEAGASSFVILIDKGSKYSKGNRYVGFPDGDDAVVVIGKERAAQFQSDVNGYLVSAGKYVYTSAGSGYLVFELTREKPTGPKFKFGRDGTFTLPGAGFCEKDKTIFITFSGSPSGCRPVSCSVKGPYPIQSASIYVSNTTSGSKMYSQTSRGLSSTLTTQTKIETTKTWPTDSSTDPFTETDMEEPTYSQTTVDPSADLDYPEATEEPAIRNKGWVLRRH